MVIIVAYGTSQRVDHLKVGEFAISRARNPEAYELAGFSSDTKFDSKQSWVHRIQP